MKLKAFSGLSQPFHKILLYFGDSSLSIGEKKFAAGGKSGFARWEEGEEGGLEGMYTKTQ